MKNRIEKDSIFEKKIKISAEMIEDLSEKEVNELNKHRTTATTMEPCDLLYIDKLQSMFVLGKGM